MPEHPLRRLLTRIILEDHDSTEIAYLHRGAQDDTKRIKASDILHVAKGSFLLYDRETQIPFHRILYIKNVKTGFVHWEKKPRRVPNQAP
jgi:uncharacterized protein (UPF0248 family)